MKRPITHILFPLACLVMLPFCLQPGTALGVDQSRNYTGGRFQLDIGSNNAGWVQPAEGGGATSDTVHEKLGPLPAQNNDIANPVKNLQPRPQTTPQPSHPCPNPPCGLGVTGSKPQSLGNIQQKQEGLQDKKDSLSETSEEKQLRLQQQMERRSKADSTMSNIQKKNSDTANGIIANQK